MAYVQKNNPFPVTSCGRRRTFTQGGEPGGDRTEQSPFDKRLRKTTTGKVKPGSKAAGRRKSFCARSKGWTGERGKAARRRWKC